MTGIDDDDAESNPFKRPGPSELFSNTDAVICMYISWGKVTFKDLLFVTRNGAASHIDNGILEVLQLEMHAVQPIRLLSVTRILFLSTEQLPGVFKYEIQVLFSSFKSGSVHTAEEFMDVYSVISTQGGYKYCLGIEVDHYYHYFLA